MKKITILLCVALLVALSACGGEDGNSSNGSEGTSSKLSQNFLKDPQENSSDTDIQIFEPIAPEGGITIEKVAYQTFVFPEIPPSDEDGNYQMYYAGGDPYDFILWMGYRRDSDQVWYRSEYYGVKNGVSALLYSWDVNTKGYSTDYPLRVNSLGFCLMDNYMRARFFRYATGKLEDALGETGNFALTDKSLISNSYSDIVQIDLSTNARSVLAKNTGSSMFLGLENEILYLKESQMTIVNLNNGETSSFSVPLPDYLPSFLDCNANYALAVSQDSTKDTRYLYNRKTGKYNQLNISGVWRNFYLTKDNKIFYSTYEQGCYFYDIETKRISEVADLVGKDVYLERQNNQLVGYVYDFETEEQQLIIFE